MWLVVVSPCNQFGSTRILPSARNSAVPSSAIQEMTSLPHYYCLLLRTETAGATKGIDKHLLRCDIGRLRATARPPPSSPRPVTADTGGRAL